jgi:hypothetical protein
LRAILQTLLVLTQQEKRTYATGKRNGSVQEDGSIKKKNVSLNQPANRGFVKNFVYIEHAKEEAATVCK